MSVYIMVLLHPTGAASARLDVLFAKAALLPGVERLVRHLHRCGSARRRMNMSLIE